MDVATHSAECSVDAFMSCRNNKIWSLRGSSNMLTVLGVQHPAFLHKQSKFYLNKIKIYLNLTLSVAKLSGSP